MLVVDRITSPVIQTGVLLNKMHARRPRSCAFLLLLVVDRITSPVIQTGVLLNKMHARRPRSCTFLLFACCRQNNITRNTDWCLTEQDAREASA